MTTPKPPERMLAGIGSMCVASALFVIMDSIVKHLAGLGYPTVQLVFCRSLFALVPVLVMLRSAGGFALLRTRRPGGHLVRSMMGMGSLLLFFYAYGAMPLADVIAVGFSAPLFMTALSVPFLGEKVGIYRWSAVLVGFAGVLVMVRPGVGITDMAALAPLAAAVFYAFAMIAIRRIADTERSLTIVFYFSGFAALVSGAILPFDYLAPRSWEDAALLVLVGLLGGTAQYFLTQAFRLAPMSVVAPFDYGSMIWAVLLGYALFGEVPAWHVMAGAVVVIASGLFILYRETRLSRARLAAQTP